MLVSSTVEAMESRFNRELMLLKLQNLKNSCAELSLIRESRKGDISNKISDREGRRDVVGS